MCTISLTIELMSLHFHSGLKGKVPFSDTLVIDALRIIALSRYNTYT